MGGARDQFGLPGLVWQVDTISHAYCAGGVPSWNTARAYAGEFPAQRVGVTLALRKWGAWRAKAEQYACGSHGRALEPAGYQKAVPQDGAEAAVPLARAAA